MPDTPRISVWSRAVSDREFCEALIADPLRALASVPGVSATPEQVRRLEAMTADEREQVIRDLVREVASRRARDQWGDQFWTPDHDAQFDVMFQARDNRPPPGPDDDDDNDEDAFVS